MILFGSDYLWIEGLHLFLNQKRACKNRLIISYFQIKLSLDSNLKRAFNFFSIDAKEVHSFGKS
jgi:hypothetical protein